MPRPGPIPVFLSEDDLRLLQTVIDEQRKMVRNTQNRPKYATDEQEQQGPEVYVGKVLETIPGIELSGGEVDVYKEIGGELVRAELTVSAFNLLGKDLRDDTWILALRDKFGTYFIIAAFDTEIKTLVNFLLSVCPTKSGVNVTSLSEMKQPVLIPLSWLQGEPICVTDPQDCCNPGTGTGTGTAHGPVVNCCLGVALPQTLTLTVAGFTSPNGTQNNGNFTLVWNGSAWESQIFGAFDEDTGEGCGDGNKWSLFCGNDGWRLQHLYLSGVSWIGDGSGLASASVCSPFSCSGSGTLSLTGCCGNGETFTWAVGGQSGGGSSIVTSCCPGGIPSTVYATFGGSLTPLGTVTLTYATGAWRGTSSACGSWSLELSCQTSPSSAWRLLGNTSGASFAAGGTLTSCNPFSWSTGDFSGVGGACPGTASVVVTETHP
jgi:hypothetical protein